MRINVDRLCELAGVPGARRSRGGLISEGADHGSKEEGEQRGKGMGEMRSSSKVVNEMPPELAQSLEEMADEEEKVSEKSDDELQNEMADDPQNEMIEINEADLVKELRRMRVKLHEARKIERRRKQNLQEAQLKAIIDQEVKNVLKELNLNSGWVYGNKKPTKSRHGYTHQGSYLKGIGFKKF